MHEKMEMINISQIQVGKHEQRSCEDPEQFAELVHSIGSIGLINMLVVVVDGDNYTLVAGHRRLAAIRKLGYSEVPCLVRESAEAVDSEITFAENFCRRPLTPIEQACAIKDCYDKGTMTVQQMAGAFHRSENWIAAQMEMVNWPDDVLEAIHGESISVAAARNLAVIDDKNYRIFLLENAVNNGATARTTSAWLQAWRASKPATEAIEETPDIGGPPQKALCPQVPCLACGQIHRMDEVSHVPMCQQCILVIRNAGG